MSISRIWVCIFVTAALASCAFAEPVISGGIVNATGHQTDLAPGALFMIFGTGLGPSSGAAAAPSPGYPASLAGTSVTFTPAGGGAAITTKIVYTSATQITGMLSSSAAAGSYDVRVAYNSQTSAPQTATVVARSFGIATMDGSGTGTVQATIANVNGGLSLTRFATGTLASDGLTWALSPAHPGDSLTIWGAGGGADAANDTGGTSGNQAASFTVSVDGQPVTPQSAATLAGFPGLWQVSFTLPAGVTTGCFVSLQVSAGGNTGNAVSIPIAAAGQNACSDENLPPAVLAKIAAGQDITFAAFSIFRLTATDAGVTEEGGSGDVFVYKASAFALTFSGPHFGPCFLYDRTFPVGGTDPASPYASLDAGALLPLAGTNLAAGAGLSRTPGPMGPVYLFLPAADTWAAGGQYTLTGNGGPQVGSFSVSTTFPTSFTVTNWDSLTAVDRTKPLTVNWTGSGINQVYIQVNSVQMTGLNQRITTLECHVPAGPGTYTIPSAALAGLLPATSTFGNLAVEGLSAQGNFTATLASGGHTDMGVFGANVGAAKAVPVQ